MKLLQQPRRILINNAYTKCASSEKTNKVIYLTCSLKIKLTNIYFLSTLSQDTLFCFNKSQRDSIVTDLVQLFIAWYAKVFMQKLIQIFTLGKPINSLYELDIYTDRHTPVHIHPHTHNPTVNVSRLPFLNPSPITVPKQTQLSVPMFCGAIGTEDQKQEDTSVVACINSTSSGSY